MVAGEPFNASQRKDVQRALAIAEEMSGLNYAVFVGALEHGRADAEAMMSDLASPSTSVLVAVDPDARTVDIVTGAQARRWLNDDRCRLAILTMSSRFSQGDIAGGIRAGLIVLGEQAMHPPVLFTDEPA